MKTKLIAKYITTSVNVHEEVNCVARETTMGCSQATEELLNEEDNVAYADSAYRSEKIETYLASVQCKSHIHEKGRRNNALDTQQQLTNTIKSKIRVRVEHAFGFMTNSMNNGLDLKAIGKQRIDSLIGLLNLTYNLFRYEQIVRFQKVKAS